MNTLFEEFTPQRDPEDVLRKIEARNLRTRAIRWIAGSMVVVSILVMIVLFRGEKPDHLNPGVLSVKRVWCQMEETHYMIVQQKSDNAIIFINSCKEAGS